MGYIRARKEARWYWWTKDIRKSNTYGGRSLCAILEKSGEFRKDDPDIDLAVELYHEIYEGKSRDEMRGDPFINHPHIPYRIRVELKEQQKIIAREYRERKEAETLGKVT